MLKRIISAAVAIPLFLIIVYVLPSIFFKVAIALVCAIAAYELTWLSGIVKKPALVILACAIAVAMPFFVVVPNLADYIFVLVFAAIVAMFMVWLSDSANVKLSMVFTSLFAAIVLPLLLSSLLLLFEMEHGGYILLIPFIAAWMTDTGAYFTGYFLGKHKLAEKISPKKTVEGAIGGIVVCILSFLLYGKIMEIYCSVSINYIGFALMALVLSCLAQIGDLSFSVIKREYNIKDYGVLFPGHGGILDRFDSVIFTVPAAYILIRIIGGMI